MNFFEYSWAWIPVTIVAAGLQASRNAIQHHLTEKIGTAGATQVRFLYGFPVAVFLMLITMFLTNSQIPKIDSKFLLFIIGGAFSQIIATALMLDAMKYRSFVIVTSWTKTEPIQVAIFGLILLGDYLSWLSILAVIVTTLGVVLISSTSKSSDQPWSLYPVLMGLAAGAFFAFSAVMFRGAILVVKSGNILFDVSWSLSYSLCIQALGLTVWLYIFNRLALINCLKLWRISIWGGFFGALASQFWFLGFALTAAANVRTLGLVEIFFAQVLTWRVFLQKTSTKEFFGMLIIIFGVVLLLISQ
jgi:drug/metabolite transporter (DMT)-like permease